MELTHVKTLYPNIESSFIMLCVGILIKKDFGPDFFMIFSGQCFGRDSREATLRRGETILLNMTSLIDTKLPL